MTEARAGRCGVLGAALLGTCVAAHLAAAPAADWWCAAIGGGGLGAAFAAWLMWRHRQQTWPVTVAAPVAERGEDAAPANPGCSRKELAAFTGPQGVFEVDTRDHGALVSASFIECVGGADWRLRHLDGVAGLFEQADQDRFRAIYRLLMSGLAQRASGEFRLHTEHGAPRWLKCRFDVLERDPKGPRTRILVVATGIGVRDSRKTALRRTALHDPLTGSWNRTALLRWRPRHPNTVNALVVVDLDGFKLVNDRHGSNVGDACLVEVARRLEGVVRRGDMVARTDGDEFAVMPASQLEMATLEEFAARLSSRLNAPFMIKGCRIANGVSVGAALGAPGTTPGSAELYATAKVALQRVKTSRQYWRVMPTRH